jgi:hypothetical protein
MTLFMDLHQVAGGVAMDDAATAMRTTRRRVSTSA